MYALLACGKRGLEYLVRRCGGGAKSSNCGKENGEKGLKGGVERRKKCIGKWSQTFDKSGSAEPLYS
jgi:hypothetical protein